MPLPIAFIPRRYSLSAVRSQRIVGLRPLSPTYPASVVGILPACHARAGGNPGFCHLPNVPVTEQRHDSRPDPQPLPQEVQKRLVRRLEGLGLSVTVVPAPHATSS
jgi:hypothetical protein